MSDKSEWGADVNPRNFEKSFSEASSRAVFIGGIPIFSTKALINSYLSSFDEVESIEIPLDARSGRPKGYAKAVLSSSEGLEKVLQAPDHTIGGLAVGISKWKDPSEYLQEKDQQVNKKIYVRYPPQINPQRMEGFFANFGPIERVDHKRDPYTNEVRYFCYITYRDLQSAQAAIESSKHLIDGHEVVCELSKPAFLERAARKERTAGRIYLHHYNGGPAPHHSFAGEGALKSRFHHLSQVKRQDKNRSSRLYPYLEGSTGEREPQQAVYFSPHYESTKFGKTKDNSIPTVRKSKFFWFDRQTDFPNYNTSIQDHRMGIPTENYKKLSENIKPNSSNYSCLQREMISENHRDWRNLQFTIKKKRPLAREAEFL